MVKIGNNELIFSQSFLLQKGETASVTPDQLGGMNITVEVVELAELPQEGFAAELNGNQIAIRIPFPETVSLKFSGLTVTPGGNLSGRCCSVFSGDMLLVHIDIRLERL